MDGMRAGRLASTALLVGAAGAAFGCSLDWTFQATPDGGKDGSGTTPDAGVDVGADAPVVVPGDAGLGASCHSMHECGANLVCHFTDHLCGKGNAGTCVPNKTGCNSNADPVCACDGTTYANECSANESQVDTSTDTSCLPPVQGYSYLCGYAWCVPPSGVVYSEFCVRRGNGGELTYSCSDSWAFSCGVAECTGASCMFGSCTCQPIDGGALLDCP